MTPELAQDLAAYNVWMNEKIYTCASKLADADRKLDRGAFFGSVHGTLNHILLADKLWMGRFTGEPFSVPALDVELHSDFLELQKDRVATDKAITAYAAALTREKLATDLHYTSMVNPEPRRYELWLAVAHFFNHQAHHRGQISTLLHQAGIDPGVTDLVFLPAVVARNTE